MQKTGKYSSWIDNRPNGQSLRAEYFKMREIAKKIESIETMFVFRGVYA